MIFSLFPTSITLLNNLKHFPNTLEARKWKKREIFYFWPQNGNFRWFLSIFWWLFRKIQKSWRGSWEWKNPKIFEIAKNGQNMSQTPKLINIVMLHHVLGALGVFQRTARIFHQKRPKSAPPFWIRPIYIWSGYSKAGIVHFCTPTNQVWPLEGLQIAEL